MLVNSGLVAIYLFVGSQWLVVAGYYYYYCLSDNQRWLCIKVEGSGGLLRIRQVNWERWVTVSVIIHMYVCTLYLRRKDTIPTVLCTDLPITTTTGEWLNSMTIIK